MTNGIGETIYTDVMIICFLKRVKEMNKKKDEGNRTIEYGQ